MARIRIFFFFFFFEPPPFLLPRYKVLSEDEEKGQQKESSLPKTYVIETSVNPEQTHGIGFRIEAAWKFEESLGICHLGVDLEVECSRAPIWGVGGMVESKLLSVSSKFHDTWVEQAQNRVQQHIKESQESPMGRTVSSFISKMVPVSLRMRKQGPLRSVMSGTEKLVAMWQGGAGEGAEGDRPGQEKHSGTEKGGGNGGGVSQALQEAILGRVETKDSDGEGSESGGHIEEGGGMLLRGSPSSSSTKMEFSAIQHHERGWGETYVIGAVVAMCVLLFILFVVPELGFQKFFQKSYS